MTLDQIERIVVERNEFGVIRDGMHNGEMIKISRGLQYADTAEDITHDEIIAAVDRFQAGDFGDFYEWDEEPTPGKEYGMYPSKYGETPHTGAIMLHRESDYIVAYFQFER